MKLRRFFIVLSFLVIGLIFSFHPKSAFAATYYVDPSITDTNPASATPDFTAYDHTTFATTGGTDSVYKTIADVNLKSFSAGDFVLFKKGGTWREMLKLTGSSGSAGNQITFGSFGSGVNPIITGADSMSGFADGGNNIWDKTGVTTQPLVVIVNGANPQVMAGSRAAVTSAGMWYWSANTLSVYATNDPSGNVEAGQRASAIDTNGKNYLTFTGLTLKGSNVHYSGNGAGLYAHNQPNTIIVNSCTITQNAGVGIMIGGTSAAFTTQFSTITYNGEDGIYNNNSGDLLQYILDSTIAYNGWGAAAEAGFGSGFQGHVKTGEFARNTVYSNGLAGPSGEQHGFYEGAQADSTLIIHNNETYGHTQGDGIKTRSSATIYNNYVHDNKEGIEVGANGAISVIYTIQNNIIANSSSTGLIEQTAGAGSTTLNAYNNTIYNNGGDGNAAVKISDSLAVFNFRNNILSVSTGNRIIWLSALQTGTVNIDNNLYYQPSDSTPFRSVSTELNFTDWEALGYDAHGLNTDPLFVNPGTDFHLTSSSPAIDTGANVGLTSDYAGTSVPQGSAPDIGAYEYISSNNTSSSSSSSSDSSAPSCGSAKPENSPQLFQINTTNSKATLYFAPSGRNTNSYAIFYGYTANDERFATAFNYGNSDGAIPYTINELEPNKTYYFKVRGGNDCMPGDWSNTLKATTLSKNNSLGTKIFTAWEQMKNVALQWINE